MKKKIIFSLIFIFCMSVGLMCFLPTTQPATSADIKSDNISCSSFQYDIVINENKVCDITETIVINYQRAGINLGIIRYISKVDTVTRHVNGVDYTTRTIAGFELLSVTMDDEDEASFVEEDSEYYYINTGADNDYKHGTHTYKLHYLYDLGEDFISDFDDFTFDIMPEDFGAVSEFAANITFPKDIYAESDNPISFRTNKGQELGAEALNFRYDAKTYTVSVNFNDVKYGTVFTMQTILPQGYFDTSFTPSPLYIIALITILATFLVCLAIALGSRLTKRCTPVVEFYPPEGLNPIDVAIIYRRKVKPQDFASLVINWAGQGLVSIKVISRSHIVLIKLKDFPEAKTHAKKEEKAYFNALFEKGDTFDTLLDKTSTKKISEAANALYDFKDASTKLQKILKLVISVLAILPLVMFMVWQCSLSSFDGVYFFFLVFPIIAVNVFVHVPMPLWFKIIWCGGFGGAPLGIMLSTYSFSYDIYSLGIIAAVALLVCTFLSKFVKIYPKEDRKVRGQILGFKNYLTHAELSKLEMQIAEDPEYFYKILPYCYVFGITKKMEKKFQSLQISNPEYMQGHSYYYIGYSIGRSMSAISMAHYHSSSGRSFGGGGGFHGSSGGGSGGGGMRGR